MQLRPPRCRGSGEKHLLRIGAGAWACSEEKAISTLCWNRAPSPGTTLASFFQPPTSLCHLSPCGEKKNQGEFHAVWWPKNFWTMLCDCPKNMFCYKCTCLYWIKRSKLQVPFWVLCLSTGLRYACSFCCYDSAGSIDPPDALNAGCFQAGKLTSLLPKLPHFPQILLVKHVYQEKHRFYWYRQLYWGSLNDSSVWQGLWHLFKALWHLF